jgi:hypothetical protein
MAYANIMEFYQETFLAVACNFGDATAIPRYALLQV